jgi:hypothetical protein
MFLISDPVFIKPISLLHVISPRRSQATSKRSCGQYCLLNGDTLIDKIGHGWEVELTVRYPVGDIARLACIGAVDEPGLELLAEK